MHVQRRTNLLWGVLIFAAVALAVANAFGVVPAGLLDLIGRAAPALLILAGVWLILRDRVRFGSLIALVIALAAVGAIVFTAYNGRASRLSNSTQQSINQAVSDGISLLRVNVSTLATDVELLTGLNRAAGVTGEFAGAAANLIEISYAENPDDTADLIVRERQSTGFPGLNDVGRGTFQLELPPDLPLDVQLNGTNGTINLNMSGLALERLNVEAGSGDVIVTLPEYDPLFSQPQDMLGEIAARNGDLTLFIPRAVSGRFELNLDGNSTTPEYDPNIYNFLVGDILESRDIVDAEMVVRYTLTVPRGRIRVEAPS